MNAAGAAIAAAIDQAIGVRGAVVELPVTPQRMHHILRRHPDQASDEHSPPATAR